MRDKPRHAAVFPHYPAKTKEAAPLGQSQGTASQGTSGLPVRRRSGSPLAGGLIVIVGALGAGGRIVDQLTNLRFRAFGGVHLGAGKTHDLGHPRQGAFAHFDLGNVGPGKNALGAFSEITLLDRGEPAREIRTADVGQGIENHRLGHPVEVVRRGGAPPCRHIDPDQAAEMIVKRDTALTHHVETGFERPANDEAKPGGTGVVAKRAEAIEPRRHGLTAAPAIVEG